MQFLKVKEIAILFFFTILLTYDYFDYLQIPTITKQIIIWLLLGLILFFLLFSRENKEKPLEALKFHSFFIIYSLILMSILTLLGGKSTSGIAFNNFFF